MALFTSGLWLNAPSTRRTWTVLSHSPCSKYRLPFTVMAQITSGLWLNRRIYPENMEVRQYQLKIVTAALFKNTMVCVRPTKEMRCRQV